MTRVLVTGASGFIGSHLCARLASRGYRVRGVDIHFPEFRPFAGHEFEQRDLRETIDCNGSVRDIDLVYHLAANMGGIGYIESHKAEIVRDNTLINHNMIEAARRAGVQRFLFSSSACVYPQSLQRSASVAPLRESDAYPADAEDGYGWEKLYFERTCRHYREDYGLSTRIVRFHNIYGPYGAYDGGREKSPAALCRKIALAPDGGTIAIWGDGQQTRSYCYIDDCVEGLHRVMESDYPDPLNLGTGELVTINYLAALIARIANKRIALSHDLSAPVGVRGRNSDNTRLRAALGWEPQIPLAHGIIHTYRWIAAQVSAAEAYTAVKEAH